MHLNILITLPFPKTQQPQWTSEAASHPCVQDFPHQLLSRPLSVRPYNTMGSRKDNYRGLKRHLLNSITNREKLRSSFKSKKTHENVIWNHALWHSMLTCWCQFVICNHIFCLGWCCSPIYNKITHIFSLYSNSIVTHFIVTLQL
jgi:hypothetical protein